MTANICAARPILFSGPMVRAILEGRKSQTRRIVKPQPEEAGFGRNCKVAPYCTGTQWPLSYYEMRGACWNSSGPLKCRYGKPGDRLWVRETFLPRANGSAAIYRADHDEVDAAGLAGLYSDKGWKPSIFMPRKLSRITLEVTEVRVERVQNISDSDCEAEGVRPSVDGTGKDWRADESGWRRTYRHVWDSINGNWDANPWVWCVSFRRVL